MRIIKENFEDKARLCGDISDFIDALEHPLEKEDDKDATLCITIQESGVRITRLYSKHELAFETPSMWSDGTIKETEKLLLDKETRDCIVNALKERLGQLKKEIRDLICKQTNNKTMKIKKYRPNFFSGFEDVYYDINSKEELLASELCKNCIDDGYEICFSKDKEDYGFIMAIKPTNDEEGAEWWVLAIIYNEQDVATLSEWLPDWNLKREEYKNKSNK